jgi:hypothetical protein
MFSQNLYQEEYLKRVLNSSQKTDAFVFSDYSKEEKVAVSTGKFGISFNPHQR